MFLKTFSHEQRIHEQRTYLEEVVTFAQVHRLLPAVITLVQVGGNAAELNELVLLKTLRERNVVEVVIGINGHLQSVIVFLVNEQCVERLVNGLVVMTLHVVQVWLDESNVIRLQKQSQ